MRSRLNPLFRFCFFMLSMLLAMAAWAVDGSGNFTITSGSTMNVGGSVSGTYRADDGSTGTFRITLVSSSGYALPASVTGGSGVFLVNNDTGNPRLGNDAFRVSFQVTPHHPGTRLTLETVQGATGGGNNASGRMSITSNTAGVNSVVGANPPVLIDPTMDDRNRLGRMPQLRQRGAAIMESNRGPAYYNDNFPALGVGDLANNFQTMSVENGDSQFWIDTAFAGADTVGGRSVSITVDYDANMNDRNGIFGETRNEWIGFGVRALPRQAELSITKASTNTGSLVSGSTVTYNIVAGNAGPASANGAVVRDTESAGLLCRNVTCTASGGAACPAGYSATTPVAFENGAVGLGSTGGVQIPTFPSGSTVTFTVQCSVTAKGF